MPDRLPLIYWHCVTSVEKNGLDISALDRYSVEYRGMISIAQTPRAHPGASDTVRNTVQVVDNQFIWELENRWFK